MVTTLSPKYPVTSARKDSLEVFFVEELKNIYGGEKLFLRVWVKMSNSSNIPKLKELFENHAQVTFKQIIRLEEVFEGLGYKSATKRSDTMEALVDEAENMIERMEDDCITKDTALILMAQKIEYHQTAVYSGLLQLSKMLELDKITRLLDISLAEEIKTNQMLANIAQNNINNNLRGIERIWF